MLRLSAEVNYWGWIKNHIDLEVGYQQKLNVCMREWMINTCKVSVNHLIFFDPSPLNLSTNFGAGLSVSRTLKLLFACCGTTAFGARVDVEARWVFCKGAMIGWVAEPDEDCCGWFCNITSDVDFDIWIWAWGWRAFWLSECSWDRWISRSCSCLVSERSWCPVRFWGNWEAWQE